MYVRRQETKVMFIDYEHVIKRCENACHHHSQMVSNLLQMTALQSRQQKDRIYMLSRSVHQEEADSLSAFPGCGEKYREDSNCPCPIPHWPSI